MSTTERLRDLLEPLVSEVGLELVDIEHHSRLLRITLDRVGGIDLEAITAASEQISALLDLHDAVPGGRYTLEVTSPGLERPLRTPEQFGRHVGSIVSVKTNPGVEGERRFQGVLTAADAEGFTIAVQPARPGDPATERRVTYEQIERARTVFEWGPAPKPGRRAARPARPRAAEAQEATTS